MAATRLDLAAAGRTLHLGGRPWLMGIVNATPDSFSDSRRPRTLEDRLALARDLVAAGADVIDVGGESGVTDRPPVSAAEEVERVAPLIERIARDLGAPVSVDTWKPDVARVALEAGACIVNDVSGLRDPALADVCAASGAALVITHTYAPPKVKALDRGHDGHVAEEVVAFLRERVALARARGVREDAIVLDPGPDFGKTPAQTVEALRGLGSVLALGRPVLLAISRKDFIGAVTGRSPRARGAGTLAALAWGAEAGAHMIRVHDVQDAADFLAVLDVLRGARDLPADAELAEGLRRERAAG